VETHLTTGLKGPYTCAGSELSFHNVETQLLVDLKGLKGPVICAGNRVSFHKWKPKVSFHLWKLKEKFGVSTSGNQLFCVVKDLSCWNPKLLFKE